MKHCQPALIDLLTRRKFGRTNFLSAALGGAYNRRLDIYNLSEKGLLKCHRPGGDGDLTRAYPMYWHYLYSLQSRQLDLNWHDVGVDDLMLAVEIWAKANNVPFEDTRDVLKGKPLSLPCQIDHQFAKKVERYDGDLEPDGLFKLGDFYFALEFDRNTEDIKAGTFKHKKSWLRTLLQYGHVFENKTYKTEWGLPSLMLLVVTTNQNHMKNIMEFLQDDLGRTAKGMCFKTIKELSDGMKCPTPNLPLFDDWQRVGHPNFNLREEVKTIGHAKAAPAARSTRRA